MLKRLLTLATHKIYNLPIVVLMPHSRCNCRCVMCDIWKANHEKKEISVEVLEKHVKPFVALGVREVVFSGGEALMHSNVWALCSMLQERKIKVTLLSTGLLLQKNASSIISHFNEVIVSVDGSKTIHDKIRNIPEGFKKLVSGVAELKKLKPDFRITARCVLQRYNYFDFENIVSSVKSAGFDQVSFLTADISTTAFNHAEGWSKERVSDVALNKEETDTFESIITNSFQSLKHQYDTKFIAESPKKMLQLVQYYKAINGLSNYPVKVCNAPWVSTVIESNGDVMPCFFHKPYGNIYENDFMDIINSTNAISFRKNLKVDKDSVCQKCVCSLKLSVTELN